MKRTLFAGLVAVGLWTGPIEAAPVVMETYGDSLTAGFLANSPLSNPPPFTVIGKIISDFASFFLTKDHGYLKPHEHRNIAWPKFLADRYRDIEPDGMSVENYAMSGAKSTGLLSQIAASPAQATDRLAYFFIGHNDIVHANELDDAALIPAFNQAMAAALKQWDARHENSRVIVLPIADIPQVFEVLNGHVWYESVEPKRGKYTCEDSWERLFPYARKLSRMFQAGTLRKVVTPLIDQMNEKLEELVTRMNETSTRGNQFSMIHPSQAEKFKTEHFAVDCYHLSEKGQLDLANAVYEASIRLP